MSEPVSTTDLSALEADPRLYLYTSLTSGSSKIRASTSRLETILKGNKIPYVAVDLATHDQARRLWGRRAGKRKLPGLVKEGFVVGDFDEVEEWNEYGELELNLGPNVPIDQTALAPATTDTSQPSGAASSKINETTVALIPANSDQVQNDLPIRPVNETAAGDEQKEDTIASTANDAETKPDSESAGAETNPVPESAGTETKQESDPAEIQDQTMPEMAPASMGGEEETVTKPVAEPTEKSNESTSIAPDPAPGASLSEEKTSVSQTAESGTTIQASTAELEPVISSGEMRAAEEHNMIPEDVAGEEAKRLDGAAPEESTSHHSPSVETATDSSEVKHE